MAIFYYGSGESPPAPPTLAQFQAFIANVMGISPAYMPPNSPQVQFALNEAINIVRPILAAAQTTGNSPTIYQLAVLNLAGHLLVEFGQDVAWPIISASPSSSPPYFSTLVMGPAINTLTPTIGGILSGTVYIQTAYAYAGLPPIGAPTPESSVVLSGPDDAVSIASLPAAPGAIGWYIFASAISGGETLQTTSPIALGSPYLLTELLNGPAQPPLFAVAPSDRVSVSGITPTPYDATMWEPLLVYSVSAPDTQAQVTYPFVANRAKGYPQITNPGPATVLPGALLSETVFFQLRRTYGINRFVPGVVTSAGDQGTSTGLLNPDFMRNLQFADLQYMKTPWGMQYEAFAQRAGPTLWGIN